MLLISRLENLYECFPKHYYLCIKDSKKLLVSFGNADSSNGKFPFFKTFDKLKNISYLLISARDGNVWYSNGLPGIADDLENMLCRLAEIILEFCVWNKIEEVIFTGASMGGVPALLISHFTQTYIYSHIKCNVLIFCTETVLFLPGSRSTYHDNIEGFKEKFPLKYIDICDLNYYANDITLYFGERCIVDAYCALRLREIQKNEYQRDIRLISSRNVGHLIVPFLDNQRGWIVDLYRQYLDEDNCFVLNEGTIEKHLCSDDLQPILIEKIDDEDYFIQLIKVVKKYPCYAYALNRLGVCFEKRGDLDNALKYLLRSSIEDNTLENTMVHLANVRRLRGK